MKVRLLALLLPILSLQASEPQIGHAVAVGCDNGSKTAEALRKGGWKCRFLTALEAEGEIRGKKTPDALFLFGSVDCKADVVQEYVKGGGMLVLFSDPSGNSSLDTLFRGWDEYVPPKIVERASDHPLVKYSNWNELILVNYPERIYAFPEAGKYGFAVDKPRGKAGAQWRCECFLQGEKARDAGDAFVCSRRIGKGLAVAVAGAVEDRRFYSNLLYRRQRLSDKIEVRSVTVDFGGKALPFGRGEYVFRLLNLSDEELKAGVQVKCTDGSGRSRVIWGESTIKPDSFGEVRCSGTVELFGRCTMECRLVANDVLDGTPFLAHPYKAPGEMELVMPAYRSSVSVARREAVVHLGVKFNRHCDGCVPVRAAMFGPDGAKIAETNFLAAASTSSGFFLPLSANAPAGRYRVAASAAVAGGELEGEGVFDVVPVEPGQVMVDQDGTILADGEPFFPLGFYHVRMDELSEVAKTGANFVEYWYWNTTATNANEGIELMKRNGMRYVFEGYAWHETVGRQVQERGLSANTPWRGKLPLNFEMSRTYKSMVTNALAISDGTLAMWYTADEASASQLPEVFRIDGYYRNLDRHHPTFTVSTGDPVVGTGADIVGFDYYNRGVTRRSNAVFGDIIDRARRYYGRGKAIIAVPQSFGDKERHPTETPKSIRSTAYLVLAHGANGILWYSWRESGKKREVEGAGNHPETAAAIRQVISEIKPLIPALTSGCMEPIRSKDGLIHAAVIGTPKTGRYLIYSNAEEMASDTVLHSDWFETAALRRVCGEGEASKLKNGCLSFRAPPLDAGVFALE